MLLGQQTIWSVVVIMHIFMNVHTEVSEAPYIYQVKNDAHIVSGLPFLGQRLTGLKNAAVMEYQQGSYMCKPSQLTGICEFYLFIIIIIR
jgi:hypothetical protein